MRKKTTVRRPERVKRPPRTRAPRVRMTKQTTLPEGGPMQRKRRKTKQLGRGRVLLVVSAKLRAVSLELARKSPAVLVVRKTQSPMVRAKPPKATCRALP